MSKMVYLSALSLVLIACGDGSPPGDGEQKTLTFHAESSDDGTFSYCDDSGKCETLPNPQHCTTLTITIDTATGKTCETCTSSDGTGTERCGSTSVACEVVTTPDPDCVVCAYINGSVVYSSCNPPSACDMVACPEYYPVCPNGQEPRRDPTSCCGYICESLACTKIYCDALMACPPGTTLVTDASSCCGTCVPYTCSSSMECPKLQHCSVDDGDCQTCNAPEGAACVAVCSGVCVPSVYPND